MTESLSRERDRDKGECIRGPRSGAGAQAGRAWEGGQAGLACSRSLALGYENCTAQLSTGAGSADS